MTDPGDAVPPPLAWTAAGTAQAVVAGLTVWSAVTGRLQTGLLGDVRDRYAEIARLAEPWVEQAVEFPPLSVAAMEPLASVSGTAVVGVHLAIQLALHLGIVGVLAWGTGPRSARRYLWWSLPILPMLLCRVDLVSMLFAALALALLARGRDTAAGLSIGAGVLAKLWPGALVVTLWWYRRRASVVGLVTSAVGVLVWAVATTPDAVRQVLGFRGAQGWHGESVAGSVVRLVDGGEVVIEAGAYRFGDATLVVPVVLGLVGLALVLAVARRVTDPARVLLTAVALFLVAAPLLSAQYAGWLVVPLAVTAGLTSGERAAAAVAVVASFGVLWWLGDVVDGTNFGWAWLLPRNVAVVVLAGLLVRNGLAGPTPVAGDVRPRSTVGGSTARS